MNEQTSPQNTALNRLTAPTMRYLIATIATLFTTVMLLQSSTRPLIGPAAPSGSPDLGREILLTGGHISVFVLIVSVWTWALVTRMPLRRALIQTVIFALMYSLLTEWGQSFVPDRTPSLYDLVVNGASALTTAWVIWRRGRGRVFYG